jgi:hypothetical protein
MKQAAAHHNCLWRIAATARIGLLVGWPINPSPIQLFYFNFSFFLKKKFAQVQYRT